MAFRHTLPPSPTTRNAYPPPPAYSNPAEPISTSLSGPTMPPPPDPASPSLSNKRQRLDPLDPNGPQGGAPIPGPGDDAFITDHDAGESGADDDDEEEKPKSDKKAGRRKIKIEFIQDKSRRHITFSKRKAGIMKKVRLQLSTSTFPFSSHTHIPPFLSSGLRTLHPHGDSSPLTRCLRDWSRIHVHHCQATTPRHPA